MAMPEKEVHTYEHANPRSDAARERYQPVSRAIEGGTRRFVGGRDRDLGRLWRRNFPYQSHTAHNGAGLSRIWIYRVPGVPRTQGMCRVHGKDVVSTAG